MDEIIADVRQTRDQVVKEFNHDLHSLCEEIRKCEKQHKDRLVNLTKREKISALHHAN